MEFDVFGPEATDDAPDCLFVLGWGNRPDHAPVRWLIDHLVEAKWRVHVATLPVHITDVGREWVAPIESYATDLDQFSLVAHSAGGLTAAHARLDGVTTRTYLSPWWGYPPATSGTIPSLLACLPTDAKVLPSDIDDPNLLGAYATDRQLADNPDRVSPRFLRATRVAHRTLPRIDDAAVVFCSLSDRVISTRAIGDRVDADRIVIYDGGHELFTARSRDDHIEELLTVVAEGPDGLG